MAQAGDNALASCPLLLSKLYDIDACFYDTSVAAVISSLPLHAKSQQAPDAR